MKKKLSVAFLWHMHQPLYKDLVTGKYHLPWVRLHSTYSYLDMAAVLEGFPGARCTFNLTPSLLWQLEDISSGGGKDDDYLKVSEKDAASLSEEEARFLLKNFFSCDFSKAIEPVKRYRELFIRRGNDISETHLKKAVKLFSAQDLRDLQVLFNLAWCGFTLKDKDPVIRELYRKGGMFTEADKKALLEKQIEVVRSIIPTYKKLKEQGKIEISTSPYYHPILPLLCKGASGQGFDLEKDAAVQLEKAVELYRKLFGSAPRGMWPSEGSVSQEIIPLLAASGIKWIASDEGILEESFRGRGIRREDLIYKAYTAEERGSEVDMLFRDIRLSNAISFSYAGMPGKKAAADLLEHIRGIAERCRERGSGSIVSVILDGENPWPYFEDGGKVFLTEVYKNLCASKEAELVTMGDHLQAHGAREKIPRLHSGSWIDRNFRKWIGSPQKDRAWEYLAKARNELMSARSPKKEALEELYIAEGSDWYWWYDEFGTELNFVFDELFRMHLANIYRLIGREVPFYLTEPLPEGPSVRKIKRTSPGEMARVPKILFISSEVVPFAKTGGLADVSGSLPRELQSLGCDVRVVMPLYREVTDGKHRLEREEPHVKHPITGGIFGFGLYSNKDRGLTTYFIKHKKCFDRAFLYGTPRGDYRDNALRFSFFCRAALAMLKQTGFRPDLIHCNDWQTALVPFYLRFPLSDDDFFRGIRTLFTIHNMAYQGVSDRKVMRKIGIPESFFNMNDLEFYGKLNFMKSGILYSDAINTVSRRYAEEIMTPRYGCGLDGLLRMRKESLYGIPNGVDYSVWSPENDKRIKVNYTPGTIDKKAECRKDLIEEAGLSISGDKPIFGSVTRLAEQKGMDLVAGITGRIVEMGAGLVVLGKGSSHYERLFAALAARYPRNVHVRNDFNEDLAHKIEAGCDIFLMPSRYEPCGLNQMYSLKYGTVPVVRATGGLDDAVVDPDEDAAKSNGFKFGPATESALFEAVKRAAALYDDKEKWRQMMLRGMACDFSWRSSAEQYLSLYRMLAG